MPTRRCGPPRGRASREQVGADGSSSWGGSFARQPTPGRASAVRVTPSRKSSIWATSQPASSGYCARSTPRGSPGVVRTAIRELAGFGLPIHVSELDVSFGRGRRVDLRGPEEKRRMQARVAAEVAEAYAELPARQRFAFTVWGLRDRDSWLRNEPNNSGDQPLMFDDAGLAKPMFDGVAGGLRV